jgi:MarR family transcriptional regulator, organic hydroperoxide resistance regulator
MPTRRPLVRYASAAENVAAEAPEDLVPASEEQSLGYQIRYAYRAFVKALAEELGPYRVTTGQWSALRVLWEQEGLSQVELAQRMMVEKASLTPVLKAMATEGLITRTRNSDDRRKVNISLTPAGRRLKSKILPLVGKINNRATRRLSAAEVHQLHILLARVMINLQN